MCAHMCMCMHVCDCVYVHVCACCVHSTHMHVLVCAVHCECVCVYTCVHACDHVRRCMQTRDRVCMSACAHVCGGGAHVEDVTISCSGSSTEEASLGPQELVTLSIPWRELLAAQGQFRHWSHDNSFLLPLGEGRVTQCPVSAWCLALVRLCPWLAQVRRGSGGAAASVDSSVSPAGVRRGAGRAGPGGLHTLPLQSSGRRHHARADSPSPVCHHGPVTLHPRLCSAPGGVAWHCPDTRVQTSALP